MLSGMVELKTPDIYATQLFNSAYAITQDKTSISVNLQPDVTQSLSFITMNII